MKNEDNIFERNKSSFRNNDHQQQLPDLRIFVLIFKQKEKKRKNSAPKSQKTKMNII